MKKQELLKKELPELKEELKKARKDLVVERMNLATRKDKNVKKAKNIRRQIAVLSGIISGRETR